MPIDIITMIVLALGFWHGFSRGIIGTLFNILAYVFGFIIAFRMTGVATTVLERVLNSDNPLMPIAGFLVNLGVVFVIMRAASGGFESILNFAYLGIVNRVLGGVLTGGFYVLIFSVLLWFMVKATLIDDSVLTEARFYPILEDMPVRARKVIVRFKPVASDLWEDSATWLDRIERYGEDRVEQRKSFYKPDSGDAIEDNPEE
ncbi:MAG: CvpA family protein [Saprospiraceae bacterium]|jgi:membrane protein required for colicin V production